MFSVNSNRRVEVHLTYAHHDVEVYVKGKHLSAYILAAKYKSIMYRNNSSSCNGDSTANRIINAHVFSLLATMSRRWLCIQRMFDSVKLHDSIAKHALNT
jgi:hypothetical protein